ncbi:MAG: response regulator [Trichodesmium sp. MO_231.B1]|nr:response regulator [Trichodesmium sp. MO_231.B1]
MIVSLFWFEIDLPVAQEWVKTSQCAGYGQIIGIKGTPPTVLVIDENLENRSLLIKLLQPIGLKVIETNDGEEGWQKIQMFNPLLVITRHFRKRYRFFAANREHLKLKT